MSRKLLRNCVLLDPEAAEPRPGALLIADGTIEAVLAPGEVAPDDAEPVNLAGGSVAPGFLDLHFHGRTIFAEPETCTESLRHDAAEQLRHGTTAFLATTVAEAAETLRGRVEALAGWAPEASADLAAPLGIHLEGPWINPEAAGAQPSRGIRPAEGAELSALLDRAEGAIRMVTLAPELEGAPQLLATLTQRGVVAALGHSLAEAAQVEEAVERGARHVTHLFNAMGPLHQRAPGLAGTALGDDRLSCDLICDGAHVAPAWVRAAARAKREQLVLITDRIDPPPASAGHGGDAAGGFGSGELHDDGVALRLPDGRLAGSRVTLDRSIANAVAFSAMTQLGAVRACTLRPARLLGIEGERGTLRRGARADLAVLDAAGRLAETWLAGRRVFAAASS